jgi:hypothetical protein
MNRSVLWTGCALLACLMGCSEPPDYESQFDQQVHEDWLATGKMHPAVSFFEQGGHYYAKDEGADTPDLDQDLIVPLLKGLASEFRLPQHVVTQPDNPSYAWAILVELPEEPATRQKLERYLEEADAGFSGMIIQQWGNRWLSLDFLDEDEAALLEEANAPDPSS